VSTILLSGASGFIGSPLVKSLVAEGHRVVRLSRHQKAGNDAETIAWDPESGAIDGAALARVRLDAVINLAGEPIAQRWTARRRQSIRNSRVNGTSALATALAGLPIQPHVFISGSAVGYYGAHRGDEPLDEDSPSGPDFLAETAREWEHATAPAAQAGIRVATARMGVVLGRDGGALARMLLPFQLGVGGRIGNGRQWMSWIALEDAVRALLFVLDTPAVHGPVNIVAPEPVQNAEFAKVLRHVMHRPSLFPVPALALDLLFGTMAHNTILASQRVLPKKLAGAGFSFRHPRLEGALRAELTR